MSPSEPALIADAVTHAFGGRPALADCSFAVPAGSVTALVGRNGAGKTTLLRAAAGLLHPDRGTITARAGARIGFLAQDAPLYRQLTVAETLRLGARLNPSWDAPFAESVAAGIPVSARVGRLAPGLRARLGLAMALGRRPDLLLLDEPLAALDPVARAEAIAVLAHTHPGGPGARLPASVGVTWLAWRTSRPYVLIGAGVVALSTVVLVLAAATVQAQLNTDGRPDCVNPNHCYPHGDALDAVLAMQLVAAFVPTLLGLLLGVPLFAPERADDTVAFALTQSVSRGRWALTKFAVAVSAGALGTLIIGLVFRLQSARYTLLANDTYELLELLHLNHPGFMVMRAVLTLAVAALLGLTTGSTLRTAVLSVVLWPFGLIASYGGPALLPFARGGGPGPDLSPDDDRYWLRDIGFADPFAWTSAAMTVVYVVLLMLLARTAIRRVLH
ncbi:ATP-binding cassette domain-containing protein [Dactylosporangium sp. NPDC000244]|uniref:ATP-binding cassette domain-containing protein n=1 Tax=Dactylosporangium sp. NPDC000244 TaxID=3154365 RepID=UPI00331886C9